MARGGEGDEEVVAHVISRYQAMGCSFDFEPLAIYRADCFVVPPRNDEVLVGIEQSKC